MLPERATEARSGASPRAGDFAVTFAIEEEGRQFFRKRCGDRTF
jgi:hypothetical protein